MAFFRNLICALAFFAYLLPLHAQSNIKTINPTFTTIDVPGAMYTGVAGINTAGDVVGAYGQSTSSDVHGFKYSNGVFTYFDYPGEAVTVPGGINDSGLIAGLATQLPDRRSTVVGFLYDGSTFTTLKDDNNAVTNVYGLNNAGVVVGSVGRSVNLWSGFQEFNGEYKAVNFPGQCSYKDATGVNNFGEIVGYTSCGLYNHGYARKNGIPTYIDVPGATQTSVLGVNDDGIAVGWYIVPGECLECVFVWKGGKYLSFTYPGAAATHASGINKAGQIVGSYTFDSQTYHGFVTDPIIAADFP